MATNKSRIQAYISNDLQQRLEEYCSSNSNISQSKAVEMILETFFLSEKKPVLGMVDKVIDRVIDSKLAPLLDRMSHFESLLEKLEKKGDSPSELDSDSLGEFDSGFDSKDKTHSDSSLESHSETSKDDVESSDVNPISEPQITYSVNEVSSDSGWSVRKIQRESKISNLEKRELLIPSSCFQKVYKLVEGTKPYLFTEIILPHCNC